MKVELDLNGSSPPEERGEFSLRLILHGRQVCFAGSPRCDGCVLVDICPSADPVGRRVSEAKAEAVKRADAAASVRSRSM